MGGQKPNEPCGCGSGKKFKKCCAARAAPLAKSIIQPANQIPAAGEMPNAGALLAQKAQFIARELGLDPDLPISDLLAAASKRIGVAAPSHSKAELSNADALMSAARSRPPAIAAPRSGGGGGGGDTGRRAATKCSSCQNLVEHVCSANGCCARCLFEIQHFEKLGHDALSEEDAAELARAGGPTAFTYGELTTLGFRQLAAHIKLCSKDVFVDCGSGTGRLVRQASREHSVRSAIGVELSSSRHRLALELCAKEAAASARRSSRSPSPREHFICSDCAVEGLWTADGALAGATVVFACSVMFSPALMARLAQCIEACSTVRIVASMGARFPHGLDGFAETLPNQMCEASWSVTKHACPLLSGTGPCTAAKRDGHATAVHIYERTADTPGRGVREDDVQNQRLQQHRLERGTEDVARCAGLTLQVVTSGATEWIFNITP